jgi:ABC-type lipoprotein release transport system permease subunit
MFAAASDSAGGVFLAIDPTQENPAVNLFVRSIVEGKLFEASDPLGIVIGRVLAEKLDVRLGKRVVYTLVDVKGEIVSEVARVRGIFESGVDDVDGSFALLPIDRVRKTLGYGAREASIVSLFIEDHRRAGAFRDRLAPSVREGETVSTWQETQSGLAGLIQIDRAMNYLFQALIAILIAAGVLNTILMSVLERRREFGMMMAIGTTPRQLFGVVAAEAFLVGLVGLIVGVVLTIPWYWFMSKTGIDLSELYGAKMETAGVLVDPVLKLRLFPESIAAILIGVFGLTMLAGLYPAWQAGREPPVETLKGA